LKTSKLVLEPVSHLDSVLESASIIKIGETKVILRLGRQRSTSTRMVELGTGVVIGVTIALPIAVFGAPLFGAVAGMAAGSMIASSMESAAYGEGFVEEILFNNHGRNGPVTALGKNIIEQ